MSDLNEFSYNLLKDFMYKFPILIRDMKNSDHNQVESGFISEWHMEGDVMTHTMMVVSHTIAYVRQHPELKHQKELLIAALLHDIGKPAAREFRSDKVIFYGHDGISTFLAINVLNQLEPALSEDEKVFILELINYHQLLFSIDNKAKQKAVDKMLDKFNTAKGREVLKYVNILRQLDYDGNISLKEDNVSHDKAQWILDNIDDNIMTTDPAKPIATMIVGLPGCGKSTYISEHYPNDPVISRDDIVMELAKPGELYNDAFHTVDQKEVDRQFNTRFDDAIKNRNDFVIDRTNLSYKGRMKFINRLRPHFNINIVVLLLDMEIVYKRNRLRRGEGKMIPEHVYRNMTKSFNMPFPTEAAKVTYIFNY